MLATLLMADRALAAAEALAEDGVSAEVIEMRWLRPLDYDTVIASVERTGRVLVVEEQVHAGGWGATVISTPPQRGVPLSMPEPSAFPTTSCLLQPRSRGRDHPERRAIAQAIRTAAGG